MNIYRRELLMMRNSLLVWSLALAGMVLMFMALYPTFHNDIAASRDLLDKFPPAMKAALNLSMETFFSFLGFYVYTFSFMTLAGAVQALNVGLSLLSKEVSSKTSDFLLSKPVSRTRIYVAKLAAGMTILFGTSVFFTAAGLGMSRAFGASDYSVGTFLLLNLSFLLVQLTFMALGVLVSQVVGRIRSVVTISLAVAFGFFVVGMLGSLTGDEMFNYLTPFKFFDYMQIIKTSGFEARSLWLVGIASVVSVLVSYVIYRLKDTRTIS